MKIKTLGVLVMALTLTFLKIVLLPFLIIFNWWDERKLMRKDTKLNGN